MKLRLGAAVLAVGLTTLTAATASAPATAGDVDITPPAVGSCHDLSYREASKDADPDAAVPCTGQHTTVTSSVVVFPEAPDWSDPEAVMAAAVPKCERGDIDFFDGKVKQFQLSTYSGFFFFPTTAQQEAGASWVRCDVGLYGYRSLEALPRTGSPTLGRLPLADHVARCRKGKGDDYNVASCEHSHKFHATYATKQPGNRYPGLKKAIRWTVHHCADHLGRSFGFYEAPTKAQWKVGRRYSVCYKKTAN